MKFQEITEKEFIDYIKDVKKEDIIDIKLHKGSIKAKVMEVKNGRKNV